MLINESIDLIETATACYFDNLMSGRLLDFEVLTTTDILDLKKVEAGFEKPAVFVFVKLLGGSKNVYTGEKSRSLTVTVFSPLAHKDTVFKAVNDIPDLVSSSVPRRDQLSVEGRFYSTRFTLNDFSIDTATFTLLARRYNSLTATGQLDYVRELAADRDQPEIVLRFEDGGTGYKLSPTSYALSRSEQTAPEPIDGRGLLKQLAEGGVNLIECTLLYDKTPGVELLAVKALEPAPTPVTVTLEGVVFKAAVTVRISWSDYGYRILNVTFTRLEE